MQIKRLVSLITDDGFVAVQKVGFRIFEFGTGITYRCEAIRRIQIISGFELEVLV